MGAKKFFGFLDIYKCLFFTLQIFKSKSCFLRFLQNWRFQTVIDYGVISGGCKSVYFYAVKKGTPIFDDIMIHPKNLRIQCVVFSEFLVYKIIVYYYQPIYGVIYIIKLILYLRNQCVNFWDFLYLGIIG